MPGTGSRHRARGRKRSDIAPAPHRGTCRTGHGRARPMASTIDCLARAAVPGRPPRTSAERSGSPTFRTSHEGGYPTSPRVSAADRATSLTMARLPIALIVVLAVWCTPALAEMTVAKRGDLELRAREKGGRLCITLLRKGRYYQGEACGSVPRSPHRPQLVEG